MRPPTGPYVMIFSTTPDQPVEFLHVKQEDADRVVLEMYASDPLKKSVWDSQIGTTTASPAQLGPRQDYVLSSDWRRLGIRDLIPPASGQPSGATDATQFTFLTGPPGAQNPPPVRGGREVALSDDGSVLLFTERAREFDGPANVEEFHLDPLNIYASSGTYQTDSHGSAEMSRKGDVIVQLDHGTLQILTPNAELRGSTRAGIGYSLAKNGRVLAVREPHSVRFLQLDAGGAPVPGGEQVFAVPAPPIDVVIAERWAVITTRTTVQFVEWPTGTEIWRRNVTEGVVASADLYLGPSGKFLIPIGRLKAQKAADRGNGSVQWGAGQGFVDLVDAQNREVLPTHVFRTQRWTFDSPRVRILERCRRVVVRSGDAVLISETLPKGYFQ